MTEPEEPNNHETRQRKMPEFIYIDSEKHFEEEHSFGGFKRILEPSLSEKNYSFTIRIFSLVFSFFLFLVTIFASFFVLFFFLLNLITFFKMAEFWKQTKLLWGHVKKIFVSALGLLVAVASPAFGFSIIMIYLFLKASQGDEENWLSRMMKDHLNR